MKKFSRTALACAALSLAVGVTLAPAPANAAKKIVWDGAEPPQGVYFYWYQPSFYTGFAPRTQDSSRIHIELSRGNQVRITVVLGDEQKDAYLTDLLERGKVYQELVEAKIIEPTVNLELDRFLENIDASGAADAVAKRETLGPEGYRARSVEIMSELNTGRMFPINMPLERVAANWHSVLMALGEGALDDESLRIDVANAALPGRANLVEVKDELAASLAKAAELARSQGEGSDAFMQATAAFIEAATGGHYSVKNGNVEALEFTAIYPAGTAKAYAKYNGTKIPDFGVTGVWPLIPRAQGRGIVGMVDYLSTNPGYGFITMLAYQHAGGIYYNAFHNAGVRSQLNSAPFLPPEWRKVSGERNPKKGYQNLWIVSRGPTSHGCTRLPSGHMSELRQILPASSSDIDGTANFRNLPQCYDVFDIDGDGTAEVMGVQYFLAYESRKHVPVRAYAQNNRKEFYQWLYGDNVAYGDGDRAFLKEVPVCRFIGKRKAVEAAKLENIPVYEAPFAPESIQFYALKKTSFESPKGFEFNREIRKVGSGHELDRGALFLK